MTHCRVFIAASLTWIAASSQPATALSLHEHESLTRDTLRVAASCFPLHLSPSEVESVVGSNVREDVNIFNKVINYSHYYNPAHGVRDVIFPWRKNALDRMRALVIGKDLTRAARIATLGQTLHYIQDMSVPAHVTLIRHGLRDSFEGFALIFTLTPEEEQALCRIPHMFADEPVGAFAWVARQTYASIFERIVSANPRRWDAFWTLRLDGTFGDYGTAGNSFGVPGPTGAGLLALGAEVFSTFKRRRLFDALYAGVVATRWWLQGTTAQ